MNTRRIDREIPSIGQLRQHSARASDQPAPAALGPPPRTAFVLSGGGNQAVSQVGMLRALLERDIVPDVVIGTLGRRAATASVIAADPDASRGVERLDDDLGVAARRARCSRAAGCARAWNLLTRDDHLFANEGLRDASSRGRHPGDRSTSSRCRCGSSRADLDTGEEVVFAAGPLAAGAPGQRRAARDLFPPVRHDGRTLVDGAVVDTVPLSHALAGPVDRIYVLNVAGELMRPPAAVAASTSRSGRSPSAASSASSSSCAACPRRSRWSLLPAPADDRELFDFSGGASSSTRPTSSPSRPSTTPRRPSAAARQLRRPWWRRDAEVG